MQRASVLCFKQRASLAHYLAPDRHAGLALSSHFLLPGASRHSPNLSASHQNLLAALPETACPRTAGPALPSAASHLVLLEDSIDHQRGLLVHPLGDRMGHSIVRLQAPRQSLRHPVFIINVLLSISGAGGKRKIKMEIRKTIPLEKGPGEPRQSQGG